MIALLQRKSLKFFHPVLRRLAKFYLSRPRKYSHKGITVKVLPGVFHPGLFFSTKVFIAFLDTQVLQGRKILELGAGSGLMSIYCESRGAEVTASDINPVVIEGLKESADLNKSQIKIVRSDLFENLSPDSFDVILINPPYYPKNPESIAEQAWFCGEEFEYFQRLFSQLSIFENAVFKVLMILSEDCDIAQIESMALSSSLSFKEVFTKRVNGEENSIFELRKN